MEEDAGKLIHKPSVPPSGGTAEGKPEGGASLVDLNRAGVPLLEIVSEPDLSSPEQSLEYLKTLKGILEYLDVSDCDMEKGSLRCDANISLSPPGEGGAGKASGTKVEIKNLNSFRAVARALAHEVQRQGRLLQDGGKVVQETRLWDDARGITQAMRTKEYAHDYRYFPEPDMVPFSVSEEEVAQARRDLPELPRRRAERFSKEYGLSPTDATALTASRGTADYYEACLRLKPGAETPQRRKEGCADAQHFSGLAAGAAKNVEEGRADARHFPGLAADAAKNVEEGRADARHVSGLAAGAARNVKEVAHWILGDLAREMNDRNLDEIGKLGFSPDHLAGLVALVDSGQISGKMAKEVLVESLRSGQAPSAVVRAKGLAQVSDPGAIRAAAGEVIREEERAVNDYRQGKPQALMFLVGRLMRRMKGAANPEISQEVLRELLAEGKNG